MTGRDEVASLWRFGGESDQDEDGCDPCAPGEHDEGGVADDVAGFGVGDREEGEGPEGLEHVGELVPVGDGHDDLAGVDAGVEGGLEGDGALDGPLAAAGGGRRG